MADIGMAFMDDGYQEHIDRGHLVEFGLVPNPDGFTRVNGGAPSEARPVLTQKQATLHVGTYPLDIRVIGYQLPSASGFGNGFHPSTRLTLEKLAGLFGDLTPKLFTVDIARQFVELGLNPAYIARWSHFRDRRVFAFEYMQPAALD